MAYLSVAQFPVSTNLHRSEQKGRNFEVGCHVTEFPHVGQMTMVLGVVFVNSYPAGKSQDTFDVVFSPAL
jgi:hypothetical protein